MRKTFAGLIASLALVACGTSNHSSGLAYRGTVEATKTQTASAVPSLTDSLGVKKTVAKPPPAPVPQPIVATEAASPEKVWEETPTPVPEPARIVPGSANDPWGPVLCVALPHPAHHKPCPAVEPEVYTAPKPPAPSTPAKAAPAAPATAGTGACGGDLPPCYVLDRESGGNLTAVSPYGYCDGGDGRCHGKWQFDLDTWHSLGYSGKPEDYPESVQDEAARKLKARSGCGQWSTC